MTLIYDLDLPEIDLFDPEFSRDPHTVYRKARESGAWVARYQLGYIPLEQEAIKFFLRADDRCRTPNRDITRLWDAHDTPFARFNDYSLMALGGEDHARLRKLVAPAFTPRKANEFRPLMRSVLKDVMGPVIPKGECEFVDAISPYPITVMCNMIGVPAEDVPRFMHWLDGLDAAFGQDASILPTLNDSIENLFGYVDDLISNRQKMQNKPQDLLQTLLDLSVDGESLTAEELKCLLIILLGAGFDTTRNQLVFTLYLMTQYPQYWSRVASEPDFVKPFIEEGLRYLNSIGATHRVTNENIEYRGITIPENTFISLSQAAAGRDPNANPDPETYDPERDKPQHITFGQGMHICLGMFIARAILEESVPMLARAMLKPELSGEPDYRHPMGMWGYNCLPLRFTPGEL